MSESVVYSLETLLGLPANIHVLTSEEEGIKILDYLSHLSSHGAHVDE
jgi:hypothetical protein